MVTSSAILSSYLGSVESGFAVQQKVFKWCGEDLGADSSQDTGTLYLSVSMAWTLLLFPPGARVSTKDRVLLTLRVGTSPYSLKSNSETSS